MTFRRLIKKCIHFTNKVILHSLFKFTYVIDQSKPIQISMAFYLSKLRKFDEISGELGLTAYFEIRWVDETLFWDPKDYGNIMDILLPHGIIWKPSFVYGNLYNDFSVIYNDETLVRLQYNGSVTWKSADTFRISCEADVSKYPFDEKNPVIFQLCHGITSQESYQSCLWLIMLIWTAMYHTMYGK